MSVYRNCPFPCVNGLSASFVLLLENFSSAFEQASLLPKDESPLILPSPVQLVVARRFRNLLDTYFVWFADGQYLPCHIMSGEHSDVAEAAALLCGMAEGPGAEDGKKPAGKGKKGAAEQKRESTHAANGMASFSCLAEQAHMVSL